MNKNKSKTLGKLLKKEGIDIQYMLDWGNGVDNDEGWHYYNSKSSLNYTDQPHLGSAHSNGVEGWYFRKSDYNDWTVDEQKTITRVIESKGYKVGSISDCENDIDDDRTWPASVTFFKIYDEKNN